MPDLRAEIAAAVAADDTCRQHVFSAVLPADCFSAQDLRLHGIPLVRRNDRLVAVFDIVLRNFPVVVFAFTGEKIHRERFLQPRGALVPALRRK